MLDYGKYIATADRYQRKARYQDREDLNHTIVLSLANAQLKLDNNGGGQLSDIAMLRVASYERQKYWRQLRRNARYISLNSVIADGDSDSVELIDTVADDKAIDLDAWLDARTWLLGCPRRLVVIAHKRLVNIVLTEKGREALNLAMPVARKVVDQVMVSINEGDAVLLEKSLGVLRRNANRGLDGFANRR